MTVVRVVKKFASILTAHQKLRVFELFLLMILGGFMEMLSVSLILPFMEAAMNPESTMQKPYVLWICRLFGINSHRSFLMVVAVLLASIYIIKNIYLVFQLSIQNRFVKNVMFSTQRKLLGSFLSRPYEYFLGVRSGELLRIIKEDTAKAFKMMTYLISLFAEFVVSAMLIAAIFIISPTMTLGMAGLLFVLVSIILKLVRPALRRAGAAQREANAKMNLWLLQAVQGIKELKIMNKQDFFEKQYESCGKTYVRTAYIEETLSIVPRFFIEASAMASFFIIVAIMLYNGVELYSIIPILSGIAMSAIRLLPSVNRISEGMANVAFGEPMLDKLIENLEEINDYEEKKKEEPKSKEKERIHSLKDALLLRDISYRYPGGSSDVLRHASVEIKKGSSVGIIGASGAGKTTAVDIMLGLLLPRDGQVLVDGLLMENDKEGWLSDVGYIPQSIFMLDASIRENVAFGVEKKDIDDEKVWNALREAALCDFVKELPEGLDTQTGERGILLSGGQMQRIGIARALYPEPSVLFFDEATSALDNETETAIMESVRRLHGTKTMIIIAHRLSTIEDCDVVYRVENGSIVPAGKHDAD